LLAERILVLDGAMGTMLQQRDLTAAILGAALEGCNENLVRTRPDVASQILPVMSGPAAFAPDSRCSPPAPAPKIGRR